MTYVHVLKFACG